MSTQATPVAAAPVDALPNATCLIQAARIAIQQDKPIQLDYFTETGNGAAYIGEDGTPKERVLFKSKDAFTSFIQKLYKVPATQAAQNDYPQKNCVNDKEDVEKVADCIVGD